MSLRYFTCRVLLPAFPSQLPGHTFSQAFLFHCGNQAWSSSRAADFGSFHMLFPLVVHFGMWESLTHSSTCKDGPSSLNSLWCFIPHSSRTPRPLSYTGARFNTRSLKHRLFLLPPLPPWTRDGFLWGRGRSHDIPLKRKCFVNDRNINAYAKVRSATYFRRQGRCMKVDMRGSFVVLMLPHLHKIQSRYLPLHTLLWDLSWKPIR